jgi:hypothetical protein
MADNKVKPVVVAPVVKEPVEEIPLDVKDKLQDMKNQKAAEQYQKTKKYAKGGTASSRADGCAQRGKTRGKMV